MSSASREVGEYIASQPLPDEQLSDDDLAVLLFVATFKCQRGRNPRIREVAAARGLTYPVVKQTIRRLRAVGQLGGLYEPSTYLWVVE